MNYTEFRAKYPTNEELNRGIAELSNREFHELLASLPSGKSKTILLMGRKRAVQREQKKEV